MEEEETLLHRKADKDDDEALDTREQEAVIRKFKEEYAKTVQRNHYTQLISLAVIATVPIFLIIGSWAKPSAIILSVPFCILFASQLFNKRRLLYMGAIVEVLCVWYSSGGRVGLKNSIVYIDFFLFVILVFMQISGVKFARDVPKEIEKLESLKYPHETL